MKIQKEYDYKKVASAISFIKENYKLQPKLEDVASHVNLSQFHFQRLFQNWAGVTPKQFLQFLTTKYAKAVLKTTKISLLDAAHEVGLSSTSRLHDLFIKMEGMSPGEFRNGGEALKINYSFADSPFGEILVAATYKGVCHIAFVDSGHHEALDVLKAHFPNAQYCQKMDLFQQNALFVFTQDWSKLDEIKLHLKGSDFQIKVWETLLKVPAAGLVTYSDLAANAGYEGASRAVGTAIGNNPIAFLIPCHRVIKATGEIGGYHWGSVRKSAIIGWEASRQAKGKNKPSGSK